MMFENSSSRILPLPYPSITKYGGSPPPPPSQPPQQLPAISGAPPLLINTSVTTYHLPPIHIPSSTAFTRSNVLPEPVSLKRHIDDDDEDEEEEENITDSPPSSVSSPPQQVPKTVRKKRQCPDCKLYFSNLATHKSTHLSINSRPHICLKCHRGFARANDLIRHENSHLKDVGKFLYKCPFYNGECHSNGCFSRCDTFKNHLKALHFQYPLGTKKKDRSKVAGECKMCGMKFSNVDEWLRLHIGDDGNKCGKSVV